MMLRNVKTSPFCYSKMLRAAVSDVSVITAILVFAVLDQTAFADIETERLDVPNSIAPTFRCCTEACDSYFPKDCPEQDEAWGRRPWFIDLADLNGKSWVIFMAAGPAFLAFILIFLDDGITKHLINHPSHKVTHGAAYNYDSCVIAVMLAVNSLLGLPWLVAATVRSLNHLQALSEKGSNGKIISVQETRLTGILIHVLVLISMFAIGLLKLIPMPVCKSSHPL